MRAFGGAIAVADTARAGTTSMARSVQAGPSAFIKIHTVMAREWHAGLSSTSSILIPLWPVQSKTAGQTRSGGGWESNPPATDTAAHRF
jgi:hypothetical protein